MLTEDSVKERRKPVGNLIQLADQPAKYVKLTDLPARIRLTPYQPGDTSISFDVELLREGGAEHAIPFRTDAPKRRKKS